MYFRGLFAFNASVPQAHTLYSHKTDKLDNKEEKWARLDRQPAGQKGELEREELQGCPHSAAAAAASVGASHQLAACREDDLCRLASATNKENAKRSQEGRVPETWPNWHRKVRDMKWTV